MPPIRNIFNMLTACVAISLLAGPLWAQDGRPEPDLPPAPEELATDKDMVDPEAPEGDAEPAAEEVVVIE